MKHFCLGFAFILAVNVYAGAAHDNQAVQARPIQLGTSGGNAEDFFTCGSQAYCASATLGALVKRGNKKFILSNNHVLARSNEGRAGDDITQPGLIDTGCEPGGVVADLSAFVELKFDGSPNVADAAIAEVRPGQVDESGAILDVGIPSATTAEPSLNMRVKKAGRTSGLTKGRIVAVDVSANVDYSDCGDGSKVALITGNFLVMPGSFVKSGDSGALVVENVAGCPRPVGLAFAGSSQVAVANSIDDVLAALNVSMVGCDAGATSAVTEDIADAVRVKRGAENALLKVKGVAGVGVGGRSVVHIYVEKDSPELRRLLPEQLGGMAVRVIETGKLRAL